MTIIKPKNYLPVIIWAALILAVSSIPHLPPLTDKIKIGDKIAHFCEYFVFGLLLANMLWRMNKSLLNVWLVASIIGTIYGILDELHQLFIPGRVTDILDMAADALGAITASLIYFLWRYRKAAPNLPQNEKH